MLCAVVVALIAALLLMGVHYKATRNPEGQRAVRSCLASLLVVVLIPVLLVIALITALIVGYYRQAAIEHSGREQPAEAGRPEPLAPNGAEFRAAPNPQPVEQKPPAPRPPKREKPPKPQPTAAELAARNEEAAAAKLELGRQLLAQARARGNIDLQEKARQRFQEVIDKYPGTEAAKDARAELDNRDR
jgi:hypothetical protein